MEVLLVAHARFAVDESEGVQRHRRQQLEEFIMKCCTGDGLQVYKNTRGKRRGKIYQQSRRLVVDIDELALVLRKNSSRLLFGKSVKRISVGDIQGITCGSKHVTEHDQDKFWLTVVTKARPYEIKLSSLKLRDQLVSFINLLKHVSEESDDFAEPGVDVLRESLSDVRASMSSMHDDSDNHDIYSSGGSARSSFGSATQRDSCSGRDSLSSVWDAKPAFRRSEANVEEELDAMNLGDPGHGSANGP